MQIVIDIPDEEYEEIINSEDCGLHRLARAIAKGILLPKGHGDLIDKSDLIPDSDYEDGMYYAVSIGQINGATTIIEEVKDEKENSY